jgi:BirA family biotin operon repressor/biotin-[acetyl-CoA-carboxylase] ligase
MKAFHYNSLPSTNDEAMKLAHQLDVPEFSYVVADEQTSGRGRNGNSWSSASGAGLYMSMILRPELPMELLPQLTLVAGVAMCEALNALPVLAGNNVGIKWPNDILLNGRKLAGILCEASLQGDSKAVIVGIGLNVKASQEQLPARVIYPATSLLIELGEASVKAIDTATLAEAFAASLKQRFLRYYSTHEIASDWSKYDLLAGTQIKIDTPDAGVVEGVATGITSAGELMIVDAAGDKQIITAGSILG